MGQGIELILGDRVIGAEPDRGRLATASGRDVTFGHLVLATGSVSKTIPALAGEAGVHTVRDIGDVDGLRSELSSAVRVAVVGGGLIGLEIATAARKLGKDVVVVEAAERLMGRVLSPISSAEIRRRHGEQGVQIRLGVVTTGVRRDTSGALTGLTLDCGDVVPCDLAVVGVGAEPEVTLARRLGLPIGDGIKVDSTLLTNHARISAIGDAAWFPTNGHRVRRESVQNAVDQARYLAARLLGCTTSFAGIPWCWSDQADTKLQMVGSAVGATDQLVTTSANKPAGFSVWFFSDDVLIGGESIDDPAGHMTIRKAMHDQDSTSPADARSMATRGGARSDG